MKAFQVPLSPQTYQLNTINIGKVITRKSHGEFHISLIIVSLIFVHLSSLFYTSSQILKRTSALVSHSTLIGRINPQYVINDIYEANKLYNKGVIRLYCNVSLSMQPFQNSTLLLPGSGRGPDFQNFLSLLFSVKQSSPFITRE